MAKGVRPRGSWLSRYLLARSCSSWLLSLIGRLRSLAATARAVRSARKVRGASKRDRYVASTCHGGMREPHLLQMASSLRQQGHDAPGETDAVLGGLRPPQVVSRQDPEDEAGLAATLPGGDGEGYGGVVDVQVLGGTAHGLTDRGRVPHGHGQGAENADVLTLG